MINLFMYRMRAHKGVSRQKILILDLCKSQKHSAEDQWSSGSIGTSRQSGGIKMWNTVQVQENSVRLRSALFHYQGFADLCWSKGGT